MTTKAAEIDYSKLTTSITSGITAGIVEGSRSTLSKLNEQAERRHELRGVVQHNADKVYEIDSELKLVKGVMVSLVGNGDGSTGLVPRMEREMKELKEDVSHLSSEVGLVRVDVSTIKDELKKLNASERKTEGFMAGWRGVWIFLGVMVSLISVVGGIVSGVIWLYTHGGLK